MQWCGGMVWWSGVVVWCSGVVEWCGGVVWWCGGVVWLDNEVIRWRYGGVKLSGDGFVEVWWKSD